MNSVIPASFMRNKKGRTHPSANSANVGALAGIVLPEPASLAVL